jgi:hypothetical protein
MAKKPEFVRVIHSKETHIHATIKCVYDLIEFSDWLAGQNLPGDTTVQFNGYYELNIHRSVDDVTSQQMFDALYEDNSWITEDGVVEYDWPEKDRRRRDREWRGPHYGM